MTTRNRRSGRDDEAGRRRSWIWTEDVHPNQYVAALATVRVAGAPRHATARVLADTKYKLYVNGRFVNAGPAPFRKPVVALDACDIAPYLAPGLNRVLIVAHFIGADTKYNKAEQPGILADVDVVGRDGRAAALATGPAWRVAELGCWNAKSPRRNWAIEHMEDVDVAHPSFRILARYAAEDYAGGPAGREPAGLWRRPRVFARPDLEVRARAVPNLRWRAESVALPRTIFRGNTEIYNLQDTAVRLDHEHAWPECDERAYELTRGGSLRLERREGEPGYLLLYDMRRQCAGDAAVEVECDAACTLDVGLAETLRADGRPIVWRNSGLYYARYHLARGLNRLRFYHFNGHRYLYLVFKDAVGSVAVRRVTTHHCRADLDFADRFASNDRESESLYRISRRSLMLNAQASLYDCNTREQGAYWGDGVWIADSVGHLTGDFAHLRELCAGMTDEYRAVGAFLPGSLYGMGQALYDYCLVPADLLARYWRYTGDRRTTAAHLPTAEAIVAAFRRLKDPNGLLAVRNIPLNADGSRKGLLFLDHPGNGWHPQTTTGIDREDWSAGFNLFYLQALQSLDELHRGLGLRRTARREAADMAGLIRETFADPRTGLVADSVSPGKARRRFSQIVNALAVTTGVLDGGPARHALRAVLDVERRPWVSQGTPYSYFFLAEAAARAGLTAEAVSAFRHDFRDMLARGATTTWEAWRAENHDSLNHAWSAPLPHLVRRGAMGLRPLRPGYAALELAPCLAAFDSFEAACRVPAGEVAVAWERVGPAAYDVRVSVPAGAAARLVLPGGTKSFRRAWAGRVRATTEGAKA